MGRSDDSGGGGVLMAFVLGGITGAALALLLAPRSGAETREYLEERLREGAERGRAARDRAVQRGREVLDEASGYVEKQRGQLERQKERLSAAVEAGKQAYREEKGEV
jgi:gas vesicle protein